MQDDTNMLPQREHSEETFCGHLLMTFAATVLRKMLQEDLKGSGACPENALMALRIELVDQVDEVLDKVLALHKGETLFAGAPIEPLYGGFAVNVPGAGAGARV